MVLSGLGLALLILWKKQITEEIKYVCRPFHQSFGPPHVVGSFFLLGWFLREVCGRWWREQSGPIKTLYFNEYPLWIKFLTLHAPLTSIFTSSRHSEFSKLGQESTKIPKRDTRVCCLRTVSCFSNITEEKQIWYFDVINLWRRKKFKVYLKSLDENRNRVQSKQKVDSISIWVWMRTSLHFRSGQLNLVPCGTSTTYWQVLFYHFNQHSGRCPHPIFSPTTALLELNRKAPYIYIYMNICI